MALFAAALRPEVRAAVVADPILPALAEVALTTNAYPYEEINDFARAHPESTDAMRETLRLFDPLHLADRVRCDVLITCGGGVFNAVRARALADAIGPNAGVYVRTGLGYLDRRYVERWIAEHGGSSAEG
jgi:hypothetical protein